VVKTKSSEPASIHWFETDDGRQEAQIIVREIISLMGGSTMLSAHGQAGKTNHLSELQSFSLSDFAVLFRTGRQMEIFEEILLHEGLPYRVTGQTETLDSTSVQEFLAFFRYLYQPEDLFLLRTALRQPQWEMSTADLEVCMQLLFTKGTDIRDDPLDYILTRVTGIELIHKLNSFRDRAFHFRERLKKTSQAIINEWMDESGLKEHLELDQLAKLAENYRNLPDLLRFLPFAAEADLNRFSKKNHDGLECITLSTIHAAKGVEYPVVFIAGVEEGLLPFGKESGTEAINEEQRLFYVGVTRAQHYLYLTNAAHRFNQGNRREVEPSRFIREIPTHLLVKQEWHKKSTPVRQLELFKRM
jgi:superfamily I DNA/RNA helicase